MISHITGTVLNNQEGMLTIDVSGIGYAVAISSHTEKSLGNISSGDKVSLFTHLAVRENAMDLYGFQDHDELELFELLIAVPGIGPKSALAILSLATPETLRQSISKGDATYLTKVSGIGKKTAQKVMLELKDKISHVDVGGPDLKEETDAVDALKSLGYSVQEARDALKNVDKGIHGTSKRVKEALKMLGSNGN